MEKALGYIDAYLKARTSGAHWFYEEGCILSGCLALYGVTEKPLYRDFLLSYMEKAVSPEGSIPCFPMDQYNVDNINAGKGLFFALDETGDARYRRAADFLAERLRRHPRCECGSFWHKEIYPDQIWLDGLYMAQPFRLEYTLRFEGGQDAPDVLRQFDNARSLLYDPGKGLSYHACDTKKRQPWANRETGCSPNFWLRAMGWYLMALIDCLELLKDKDAGALPALLLEACQGILPYREEKTGLFYQVIDRPEAEGNYLETSGSAMVLYAFMKGARLGVLPPAFWQAGRGALDTLIAEKLKKDEDGQWRLEDICRSAGLGPGNRRDGSVSYYLSEPRVSDDGKGVGPLMMAVSEALRR